MDYKEGILNDIKEIERKINSESLETKEDKKEFWDKYLNAETGVIPALYQRVVDATASKRPKIMRNLKELKEKAQNILEESKL